jgi:hypothetical protein
MHSVNGEWLNSTSEDKNTTLPNEKSTVLDENSNENEYRTNNLNLDSENQKVVSDFGENVEGSFTPDSSGILDFMNLICMSTPALNTGHSIVLQLSVISVDFHYLRNYFSILMPYWL